jgi:hypothetical protein
VVRSDLPFRIEKAKVRAELALFLLFLKSADKRWSVGWRGGFLLSAAEQYLKLELTKNFKASRY